MKYDEPIKGLSYTYKWKDEDATKSFTLLESFKKKLYYFIDKTVNDMDEEELKELEKVEQLIIDFGECNLRKWYQHMKNYPRDWDWLKNEAYKKS